MTSYVNDVIRELRRTVQTGSPLQTLHAGATRLLGEQDGREVRFPPDARLTLAEHARIAPVSSSHPAKARAASNYRSPAINNAYGYSTPAANSKPSSQDRRGLSAGAAAAAPPRGEFTGRATSHYYPAGQMGAGAKSGSEMGMKVFEHSDGQTARAYVQDHPEGKFISML
jgi:hypothetical protein